VNADRIPAETISQSFELMSIGFVFHWASNLYIGGFMGLQRQVTYNFINVFFDPYSNSKACAELAVSAYRNSFFAENVIGGGDWSEDRLLPDVFRSLIFGEKLSILNPASIRPWQHALEPLAGYLKLAEKLYAGERWFAEAWNFGPSDEDSKPVGWILEEIKRLWNESVNWEIADGKQPHEAHLLKFNSAKAKNELDWSPKLSLEEAVKSTAEWYRGFKDKQDLVKLMTNQISFYQNKNQNAH